MNITKFIDKKRENRHNFSLHHISLLIITLVAIVLLINPAYSQEEMKKSIQIINPRPDFALSLRLDKGTGATYSPGENIRIYFRSTKNAYVTIFSYDSDGKVTILFPNRNQKNDFIEANKQYNIDGVINIDTRPGIEYIQGFATTEPIIMSRELERIIERELFPRLDEGMTRFTQRIKGMLTALSPQRWVSSEVLHYQVVNRREETGQLRLDSSPSGAEVYLNDRYAGKTPLLMEQVRTGEYLARVEMPGYQTWSRTVQISPDRTSFVQANLIAIERYGSIAIRGNQDGGRIYLDDQYKGLTEKNRNVILEQVMEGIHDLRIILSGYRDWSQRIEVKANQRLQITANLDRVITTGNLEVVSDVDNARIYLNDKYQKSTVINRVVTINNLQEGNYELRITKDGYHDYVENIRIYPDETYRLNVNMRPVPKEGGISIICNESNARIFVNGTQMATTIANQVRVVSGLKEGIYEVVLIKEGFRSWIDEVRVFPGETTTIYTNLKKMPN